MVAPRAMHQQQFTKEAELRNRHIGGPSSLKTFDAADTDTNMSGLDHRHIVGAIANGKKKRFEMTFNQLDDQGFLKGRNTTDRISLRSQ